MIFQISSMLQSFVSFMTLKCWTVDTYSIFLTYGTSQTNDCIRALNVIGASSQAQILANALETLKEKDIPVIKNFRGIFNWST